MCDNNNNNNEQQQENKKIFYIAEDEELDNLHNMRYYEDLSEDEYEKDVDAKIDEFREYVRGYIDNYMDEKYTMDDLKKLDNWQYYLLSSCVDLGEIDDDYHFVPMRRTKSNPDLVSDEKLKKFREQKQELNEENRKLDELPIDEAVLRFKKLYEKRAIKL